jgi:hypothetical protein
MGWLWVGAVDGFGELFWGEAVEFSAGVEVGADVVFGERGGARGGWFVAHEGGQAEVVGLVDGVFVIRL